MLEQIDHRGKRFTIGDEDVVDDARDRCRRAELLERQAQRERSVNSSARNRLPD